MTAVRSYTIEGRALGASPEERRRITVVDGRVADAASGEVAWRLGPGETLLPAFHDHHTHLIGTYRPEQGPSLHGARSREDALERLAAWLRGHPGVDPVLGEGWDESQWEDPRPLTGEDLDAVESGRAVALRRVCGHLAVANRTAWRILAPRGSHAHPETGTLAEDLAMELPRRWPVPLDQLVRGALDGQRSAFRLGVTAIDEMGRPETFEAFRVLEREGLLRLRVRHFFPLERRAELTARGLGAGSGASRLRIAGLKGFLDGSIGARTAAVAEPYADRSTRGALLWEDAALREAARDGASSGFTIALHAIGARAVAQGIEALANLPGGGAGGAHRIEHVEQIDGSLLFRARESGVRFSMQPNFTARWQGEGGLYARALGEEGRLGLNRYRSASDSVPVLFGSDTMPMGPLIGIAGALGHPDPRERLPLPAALRAYRSGGLEAGGADSAGPDPFAIGSPADLIVVRRADPRSPLDGALREGTAEVVWTAAAGEPVYGSADASAPAALRGERA